MRKVVPCLLLLALFGVGCGSTSVVSFGDNQEVKDAIAKVYPALVRIVVVVPRPRGGRIQKLRAGGSGAIISPDGYVVTNHHVAGNATRIVCRLANEAREEIEAELVGTDPMSDIAVLKLRLDKRKDPSAPIPVAHWGDSTKVKVGDVVMALGSPGLLSQSVTQGIVSNVDMIMPKGMGRAFKLDGESVGTIVRWIAHDAVIFGGNSGGPLVNTDGEIIGINEIGVASLGGAIPSKLARRSVADIIAHGAVQRSWAGIEFQPRLKTMKSQNGSLVSSVLESSPAAEAGIKAGDIVLEINGEAVNAQIAEEVPPCNFALMCMPANKVGKLTILRDGEKIVKEITPEPWENALPKAVELKSWGMVCREISRRMALALSRKSRDGVQILSTRPGRAAADAKPSIAPGDIIVAINGKPVKDIAGLQSATKAAIGKSNEADILVEFERGKGRYMTVAKVRKKMSKSRSAIARKAWMPVSTQVLTSDLSKALGLKGKKGVRVVKVYSKLAGKDYPIKAGDILLKFDGDVIDARRMEDTTVFSTMVKRYRIGNTVPITLIRGGKEQTVKVKLSAPPKPASQLKTIEDETFEFAARNLHPFDTKEERTGNKKQHGVMVTNVENSGWASLAGLRRSDILVSVNGQTINTVDTLKSILEKAKASKTPQLVFFVRRGIHTHFLTVEPDWK